MSIDQAKRAIAAFLLHLLTAPKEAFPKEDLLAQVAKEGHRRSDVLAALFEMEKEALVRTETHTEIHESNSILAHAEGVFLTDDRIPEPWTDEWLVVRPLPALEDWWKNQRDTSRDSATEPSGYGPESQGSLRVIEIPLGAPENEDSPANEEGADAGRDQGGARQGEVKAVKPRRGRKSDRDPKADKRVSDAWGTGQYKTYEECGNALGKTKKQVAGAIDRHRKRRKAPE